MRQLIAARAGMYTHALVGQVADVPAANTCRVNEKTFTQTTLIDHALQYSLGSRRAANIAQTNEEYVVFSGFCHFEGAILQKM
jgi:hypothetical protein